MSSKDLEGIRLLPEFIEAKIDSLKVEGRNKSHHYAGTVSKVYSEALKFYKLNGNFLSSEMLSWENELRKVSHRDYTTGSLDHYAESDSIYNHREHDDNQYVVSGIVLEAIENRHILIDVKSAFVPGDILEVMPFSGKTEQLNVSFMQSLSGVSLEKSKPGSVIKIPYISGAQKFNIIRKRVNQ